MSLMNSWIIICVVLLGCLLSLCMPTPLTRKPSLQHRQHKRSVLDANPVEPWGEIFSSGEDCQKALRMLREQPTKHTIYGTEKCGAFWDGVLCWPATPAGTTVYQSCPNMAGLDPQNFAERICSDDGSWQGRPEVNAVGPGGWTDYRPCYTPYARALYEKYYGVLK